MKKIAILGSTGSIGTQTVDILPSVDAEVVALTTNKRINLLEEQARALHPKMVCAFDEEAARSGAAACVRSRGFVGSVFLCAGAFGGSGNVAQRQGGAVSKVTAASGMRKMKGEGFETFPFPSNRFYGYGAHVPAAGRAHRLI